MDYRLLVTVRKVIVPGHPQKSHLFELITSDDDGMRMPEPPNDRLSEGEIATIRRWIEEGAPPFPVTNELGRK
jgi:Planctomycete cytochrome C